MSQSMKSSSRLKAFYKLGRAERLVKISEFASLPLTELNKITRDGALDFDSCNHFVENAIGSQSLPLGIATSFKINDRDYLVPMAVEESSVIAAASNAAKIVYESGGFECETISNLMIGQIQILDLSAQKMEAAQKKILAHESEILKKANEIHPRLVMRGGGAKGIETQIFTEAPTPFLTVQLLLDTKDAMGANLINTACEKLASYIQELVGGRVGLRILSNNADKRLFSARCKIPLAHIGQETAQKIVEAYEFADHDPYRAATHNKGIMNGVDPVVIATGNDWRAIEAGAHSYAARTGRYRSLSQWKIVDDQLIGELRIPLQLGTVGGVTRLHPVAKICLGILQRPGGEELSHIIAASGLASNLAALRALCTTGIQRGHMKLHAKNLALAAGAKGPEVEAVAKFLITSNDVSASTAEKVLNELRDQESSPNKNSELNSNHRA